MKDINKNYLHQNEIYEQVDLKNDPDLLQLAKEKKEFFEYDFLIIKHSLNSVD